MYRSEAPRQEARKKPQGYEDSLLRYRRLQNLRVGLKTQNKRDREAHSQEWL
jgi:hypothetical protein